MQCACKHRRLDHIYHQYMYTINMNYFCIHQLYTHLYTLYTLYMYTICLCVSYIFYTACTQTHIKCLIKQWYTLYTLFVTPYHLSTYTVYCIYTLLSIYTYQVYVYTAVDNMTYIPEPSISVLGL